MVSNCVLDGSAGSFAGIKGEVDLPRLVVSMAAFPASGDFWTGLPIRSQVDTVREVGARIVDCPRSTAPSIRTGAV
jgi:hypothetical protein